MTPFTIRVRFLTGYCVAARAKHDPEPEWPPHPARLFMAMASAYFESDGDPDRRDPVERAALVWVESLPAPSLAVPAGATPNPGIATFVPANDDESAGKGGTIQTLPALRRHRAARLFPRTHLSAEDDTVSYVFADAALDDVARHGPAMRSLCARVGRLGHSTSLVQVTIDVGQPASVTHVPTEGRSELRLRTVARSAGTLDRLTAMFERPPHRPTLSQSTGYTRVGDAGDGRDTLDRSVFDAKLDVFRIEPADSKFRSLDLGATLPLTRQLHEAVLANAGEFGPVPEVISGHREDGSPSDRPHLAYLPIPFVGGEFGDGHLLGFAVAVPRDLGSNDEGALVDALRRLVEKGLTLGELGTWRVTEDAEPRLRGANLLPETWTAHPRGATTWASVTPVAFDQHPRAKEKGAYLDEAAELIAAMFDRIGLPRPRVRVMPVSPFAGVPTARDFPRLMRKKDARPDGERRHTHVLVEFDALVVGPVLVGAGRYRGYGLLRPLPQGGTS